MRSDGYADHDVSEHVGFLSDVWHEPSGEHGMSGEWLWCVDEIVYNNDTEEEETLGCASGYAQTEADARACMEAALLALEQA